MARMGTRAGDAESLLWSLMANVPGVIYRCEYDEHWTMRLIGDEIERISGYPASDFVDNAERTFASVIHPDDLEEVDRLIGEATAEGRGFALEYRIVRADGDVRWVLERGQLATDVAGNRWLDGVIFDITERRLAEQAAHQAELRATRFAELQASSRRIVEASDRARRTLERDLHDGAQQRLVSAALTLRVASSKAEPDSELAELLDEVRDALEAGLAELRDLARGIHPAVLTDAGLVAAVEALASRCSIPVTVRASSTYACRRPSSRRSTSPSQRRSPTSRSTQGRRRRRCGSRRARDTRTWRYGTTAAVAPTRYVAPGFAGLRTGCPRSAAGSRWPTPRAEELGSGQPSPYRTSSPARSPAPRAPWPAASGR